MTIEFSPRQTIYALRDPVTQEIRYVGRTQRELTERLAIHRSTHCNAAKRLWIDLLEARGLQPLIEQLEVIVGDRKAHAQAEGYWIDHLRSLGHRLFNKQNPSGEHIFNGWVETDHA